MLCWSPESYHTATLCAVTLLHAVTVLYASTVLYAVTFVHCSNTVHWHCLFAAASCWAAAPVLALEAVYAITYSTPPPNISLQQVSPPLRIL